MSKKKDSIIKDYLKRKKQLEEYNKFYYDKDSPVITDQQYDEIKKEIIKVEKSNIFLKKYSSINKQV